jgi:hypothetical protein
VVLLVTLRVMAATLINVNVGLHDLLPIRADHLHLPLTGRHLLTAGAGVHQGVFLCRVPSKQDTQTTLLETVPHLFCYRSTPIEFSPFNPIPPVHISAKPKCMLRLFLCAFWRVFVFLFRVCTHIEDVPQDPPQAEISTGTEDLQLFTSR